MCRDSPSVLAYDSKFGCLQNRGKLFKTVEPFGSPLLRETVGGKALYLSPVTCSSYYGILEQEKPNPSSACECTNSFPEILMPVYSIWETQQATWGKDPPRWGLIAEHPYPRAHAESLQICCKTFFPANRADGETKEFLHATFKCM